MNQAIENPHGVSTFGSCVVYVDPDHVSLDFAITRASAKPNEASNAVRAASATVEAFLKQAGLQEGRWRASRVKFSLAQGKHVAEISYNLSTDNLDLVEPLVVGLLNAGANDIRKVTYRSSRMRDGRSEARQGAFLAALKKAEAFCEAAGVKVGRTIHIEELAESDPLYLESIDEFQSSGAVNPNSILVTAAVRVSFTIKGGISAAATGQFVAFDP